MGAITSAKSCSTRTALDDLVQFNRKFNSIYLIQPPADSKVLRPSWPSYEHDLYLYHGYNLSENELTQEMRKYLHLWCARDNFDKFRRLANTCQRFFRELTLDGRQSLLGSQANLEPWEPLKRSRPRIEFKPPKLPVDVAATFDEYQESLEIPHCLGGRLIWWLAAWTAPSEFGYSKTSLQKLFSQPLWYFITSCKPERTSVLDHVDFNYECTVDMRPIELICEAAALCASAPMPLTTDPGKIIQEEDRPKYGMVDDRNFYWNGEEIIFGPKQGPFVKTVLEYHKKSKKAQRHILEKNVWKGETTGDSNIRGHITKINKQFGAKGIPLVLHILQEAVSLEYIGPDSDPLLRSTVLV